MRKFLIGLLALPLLAVSQDKTVVSVNRVFPKPDKVQLFEKAIGAHAQKYHKGDYYWRVFYIESGPDAGGYHITEGPTNWEGVDKRADISVEHTADWDKMVQPYLTEKSSSSYSVYRADLSSVALTEYSDKIAINHVFYKPGYLPEMEAMFNQLKKTWTSSGQSVAVYESSSSGEPQFAVVTRYKQGLKERERGFRAPMKDRYEKDNGDGSWAKYNDGLKMAIDHSWSELLTLKPALGSK
jgi:hypothetical protein